MPAADRDHGREVHDVHGLILLRGETKKLAELPVAQLRFWEFHRVYTQ